MDLQKSFFKARFWLFPDFNNKQYPLILNLNQTDTVPIKQIV